MDDSIRIRIDSETKKQFGYFCDSIGLTMSAVLQILIRASLREQRIPYEIKPPNDGA